jgi:hypothetical protein
MASRSDRIERMMQVAKDTKKEFTYRKDQGKWSWHEDEEFDTFLECLEDAVGPYFSIPPTYNTMFDVAFSVNHDCEDPQDVPMETLLSALQDRIDDIRSNNEIEAFGLCDTYSNIAE